MTPWVTDRSRGGIRRDGGQTRVMLLLISARQMSPAAGGLSAIGFRLSARKSPVLADS